MQNGVEWQDASKVQSRCVLGWVLLVSFTACKACIHSTNPMLTKLKRQMTAMQQLGVQAYVESLDTW